MQIFSTARLQFRPLQMQDRAFYLAINTDSRVMKFNGGALSETSAQHYFELSLHKMAQVNPNYICWVITTKKASRAIGLAFLVMDNNLIEQASFGITLLSDSHGQGYGLEAKGAVVEYGFERCGLKRVNSSFAVDNKAMARINEKLKLITNLTTSSHHSGYIEGYNWQSRFIVSFG